MTDDEAEAMLKQLTAHYRSPVMPLRRFCDALQMWIDCVEQGIRENPLNGSQQGLGYAKHLMHIMIDISKSALLGRMFYGGEKPRTVKCPRHQGHWEGIPGLTTCEHGCHLTGWLPNEEGAK